MYQCKCRALTLDNEPFHFSAKDVPVQVFPDIFTLANRQGTPLLKMSSICKLMDHLPLGEGDRVTINHQTYVVSYYRGFCFVSNSGHIIPSHKVTSYKFLEVGTGPYTKVLFKYRGHAFSLPSLLGCFNGKAFLAETTEPVNPEELQTNAGFRFNKKRMFFGDQIDKCEIVMWRGRICLRQQNGYIDIPTGKRLGGDIDGSYSQCSG